MTIRSAALPVVMALLLVRPGLVRVAPRDAQAKPPAPAPAPAPAKAVTFTADIAPMLAANCQPCHFKGGKVFDRLPFDEYETVRKVGAKLNTRLKDKNADLVTRWLKGGSPK